MESLISNIIDRLTSEMRTETNHLAVQMRRQMTDLVEQVDQRRDLLRNERDLFESSTKLASNRSWLLAMQNGRYCCGPCTAQSSFFTHRMQKESPWLLSKGGIKFNARFSVQVCKHEDSDMHILAIELEEERVSDPLQFSLQQQLLKSRTITGRLMKTAYDNALHYRSFLDYENIVWLQHNNDLNVGDQLHQRQSSSAMIGTIYRTDRKTWIRFLSTPNKATGRLL